MKTYSVGDIVPTEGQTLSIPRTHKDGYPAVLVLHGALGTSLLTGMDDLIPPLVRAGYTVLTHDLGGVATYDNDDARAATTDCMDFLVDRGHEDIFMLGGSMGGMGALGWIREFPDSYTAATLVVPALNMQWVYDNNPALQGSIDAAHGGSWAAARADHDPWLFTDEHQTSRVQVWYSLDDDVTGPDNAINWCSAVGITPRSQGLVGHTSAGVDVDEVIRFWDAHAGSFSL